MAISKAKALSIARQNGVKAAYSGNKKTLYLEKGLRVVIVKDQIIKENPLFEVEIKSTLEREK